MEKNGGPIGLLPAGENIERQRVLADFDTAERLVREVIERAPQLNAASEGAKTWQERGLCRYPEDIIQKRVHFPPVTVKEERRQAQRRRDVAKALCAVCPVREPCLEAALKNNEKHGVWGGLSEFQRAQIQRQRREAGIALSKSHHPSSWPHPPKQ